MKNTDASDINETRARVHCECVDVRCYNALLHISLDIQQCFYLPALTPLYVNRTVLDNDITVFIVAVLIYR